MKILLEKYLKPKSKSVEIQPKIIKPSELSQDRYYYVKGTFKHRDGKTYEVEIGAASYNGFMKTLDDEKFYSFRRASGAGGNYRFKEGEFIAKTPPNWNIE